MKQVRYGTFETNSSSTHALVLFNDEDYQKFKDGEIILDDCCKPIPLGKKKILPRDEDSCIPYAAVQVKGNDNHYYTYSSLDNACEYEEQKITTAHGDVVHGISIYMSDC